MWFCGGGTICQQEVSHGQLGVRGEGRTSLLDLACLRRPSPEIVSGLVLGLRSSALAAILWLLFLRLLPTESWFLFGFGFGLF